MSSTIATTFGMDLACSGSDSLARSSSEKQICFVSNQGLSTFYCKRGRTRGDGTILRFPDRRESDSFWEWYRLAILTVYLMPS
jgi:hypothetical protein